MKGTLVRLSETRWRYTVAPRSYYVRRVGEGEYRVAWRSDGRDKDATANAATVEQVAELIDAGASSW
ncbi:MAG TPA: hypothetical protein VM529_09470 [Gemmata sp.]|nr:hypothetical protein [Gemmata sp.]